MFMTLQFWVWVASAILFALYGAAGVAKSSQPIPDLTKMLGWPGDVPPGLVRFIGVAEIAGALGLILPVLTGILVWLTPLAALGLSTIQVLAIVVHVRRGDIAKALPLNLVLLALSFFVLWAHRGLLGL
jgi:hypothetical protein